MLDYRDVIRALQVRLIQTPLSDAKTLSPEQQAASAARALRADNYDQAPVVAGDRVIGVARRDDLVLAGTVREALRELSDDILISADTSLADIPRLLASEPFIFVVDGTGISGFVTPWDLNKQPARAHLYLLLADLEMSLASLLRRRYRAHQAAMLALLKPDRAKRLWGRFRKARREDRESDLAALLDFQDLLEIAGADQYVRRRLGQGSPAEWTSSVMGLGDTREGVMHLTGELVGARLRLDELIDIERRVRTLAAAAARVRRVTAYDPGGDGHLFTQRVTSVDLQAGRLRLPKVAKLFFPSRKARVPVSLRGRAHTVSYDPRMGPDRERSGVLIVGRQSLEAAVRPGERLLVSTRGETVHLD